MIRVGLVYDKGKTSYKLRWRVQVMERKTNKRAVVGVHERSHDHIHCPSYSIRYRYASLPAPS